MRVLFAFVLMCIAGVGTSVLLRCKVEEGLVLTALGLSTATYLLALCGWISAMGAMLWLAALIGLFGILYAFVKKTGQRAAFYAGGLCPFAFGGDSNLVAVPRMPSF